MALKKLKEFLDAQNIKYMTISHSLAYTAQAIATLTHTPGKELAKTVIVKINDELAMAVLPASCQIDIVRLQGATGAKVISIAKEKEFKDRFAECEVGAMPPFGNLYNMPVFVDESLTQDKEIAFNAGSHRELVRLAYEDFERLVKPTVLKFSWAPDVESRLAWHL